MRARLTAAGTALWLLSTDASASCLCGYEASLLPASSLPRIESRADGYSSFRGISLSSSPDEIARAVAKLGFTAISARAVGAAESVSSVEICKGSASVGTVYFDRRQQIDRMILLAGYFQDGPVREREFADAMFESYSVRPLAIKDDLCFQDIHCFRGSTEAGEYFLIAKIGGEIQLYVRSTRPAEWSGLQRTK